MTAQIADTKDGFTARIDTVPTALRDQLPPVKDNRLHFHKSLPVPIGHHVLTRTDSAVEALSRYVLDAALDADLDQALRPARRAGVMRTAAVGQGHHPARYALPARDHPARLANHPHPGRRRR